MRRGTPLRELGQERDLAAAVWRTPAHEAELCEIVRGAGGLSVRVVGAGHSWSAIAAPEQIAVTIDQLTGSSGAMTLA